MCLVLMLLARRLVRSGNRSLMLLALHGEYHVGAETRGRPSEREGVNGACMSHDVSIVSFIDTDITSGAIQAFLTIS